jgi:hypothetical protein
MKIHKVYENVAVDSCRHLVEVLVKKFLVRDITVLRVSDKECMVWIFL